MKILFYSPVQLTAGNGCERWHCDVTSALQNDFHHTVKIMTANLGKSHWTDKYLQSQLQVPYELVKFPIFFGALVPTPKTFFLLLKNFRDADVIHIIQGFIGQDIFVLLLKLFSGKKVIVGHHAPIFHDMKLHNFYMRHVTRHLLNLFDAHMTLNSADKRFLESSWGIKNVNFIPSGIRTHRFLRLKRSHHDHLNFLTVGSYRRQQKGIDLAQGAISLFNSKYPKNKVIFNFVGGGLSHDLLPFNVKDLGFISYEKIPSVYAHSDVYFLSSREEPFGLVMVEAWSAGLPVLATRTEGPLDMVRPDVNGWFIETVTSKSMFLAIERVYLDWIQDPKYLSQFEKVSRQTGIMFDITQTAKKMSHLFARYG